MIHYPSDCSLYRGLYPSMSAWTWTERHGCGPRQAHHTWIPTAPHLTAATVHQPELLCIVEWCHPLVCCIYFQIRYGMDLPYRNAFSFFQKSKRRMLLHKEGRWHKICCISSHSQSPIIPTKTILRSSLQKVQTQPI